MKEGRHHPVNLSGEPPYVYFGFLLFQKESKINVSRHSKQERYASSLRAIVIWPVPLSNKVSGRGT